MQSLLTLDDGWPLGPERAAMARRIAVVDWFRLPRDPHERIPRLARAIASHVQLTLAREAPEDVRVLGSEEGRRMLSAGELDVIRPGWKPALEDRFELVRHALMDTGRDHGHPLLHAHESAAFPRCDVLPLDPPLLQARLEGATEPRLSSAITKVLVDRVQWEMAALLLHEAVADHLGANPFVSLLVIYEEGYFPLDLSAEAPLLWAP